MQPESAHWTAEKDIFDKHFRCREFFVSLELNKPLALLKQALDAIKTEAKWCAICAPVFQKLLTRQQLECIFHPLHMGAGKFCQRLVAHQALVGDGPNLVNE